MSHFNEPTSYVIGSSSPPYGAVLMSEDFSSRPLDLAVDCGARSCPSVLIFSGQQWGTVSVVNCRVGQQYMFVNRSSMDLGIVVQQNGGSVGSKGIAQFDLGTCFCLQSEDTDGSINETSEQGNQDEFSDAVNLPYPTQASRDFLPIDRVSGSSESIQRNIFGTHFRTCFDLSAFELDKLDQFHMLLSSDSKFVADVEYPETQRLRFLQGCNWNMALARNSLKEYLEWKRNFDLSNFDPLSSHPIIYWFGRDKSFRPVLVIRCSEISKMPENSETIGTSLADILVNHMAFFVQELTVPDHVEQLVVIVDLSGFSLWAIPFSDVQKLIHKLSSYFRSRLNKVFLINTPILFYGIWNAIKSFIPERTLSKIHIFGTDYMNTLFDFIDTDEVCPFLTGVNSLQDTPYP